MTGDSVFTVLGDNEAGWGGKRATDIKIGINLHIFFCLFKFQKDWCWVLTVLCNGHLHAIVSILKEKKIHLVYSLLTWSQVLT